LLGLLLLGAFLEGEAATWVATNSVWRFKKGTNEVSSPVEMWRGRNYVDSGWPQGATPFYFGENNLTGGTRLTDMQNRYTGIFLRQAFAVADPAEITAAVLSAASDDGFVAWINGTEVVRYRVNEGPLTIATVANSSAPEPIGYIDHAIANPARYLVAGANVLAVQAFNRLKENGDFQINIGLVGYIRDDQPPVLVSVSPPAGVADNLETITVVFSEPVTGLDAEDLLLNTVPADRVEGAGTTFSFTFRRPAYGEVIARWATGHGITDLALPANPFDPSGEAAAWTYTYADLQAPTVTVESPAAGTVVRRLSEVEICFDEPVVGLEATDLLVNGRPATGVSGVGAGPFVFRFPQPPAGPVVFAWAVGHGVTDRNVPGNGFAGGSWECALDPAAPPPAVVINELCAANVQGLKDEDGEAEDWIELRNLGMTPVDLTGWGLTDEPNAPGKWVFPRTILGGGQYLVLFASAKGRKAPPANARMHTNFKLADDGEYLGLYDAGGPRLAVSEFAPRFPDSRNDYSYGWAADGTGRYFSPPTPGAMNGTSTITGVVSRVKFSVPHGFHDAPFDLVLSNETPEVTIRYTLDGAEPTASVGQAYAGPIHVDRSTVVRAAAFAPNRLPSRVETVTFLFTSSVLEQPAAPSGFPVVWGSSKTIAADYAMDTRVTGDPAHQDRLQPALLGLPALSLVMPVEDWFSPARGIYSNGEKEGLSWERRCSAELLWPDGREGFQVNCGVRIQGGTSPTPWRNSKLSMRLFFRSDYGPKRLDYDWFPDSPVGSFDRLILDAGYNYTWSYAGGVEPPMQRERAQYVRDQFASDLQKATGTPAFHGRYAHLFINGLYWGLYDVHEDPEAAYAADHYGGTDDEYDVIKHTGSNVIDGNAQAWNGMMTLARAGLEDPGAYAALGTMLDIPGLIDYLLVHFYIGNTDWPHHNWYAFRRRTPGAQWRFVSYDSEHCLKEVNHDRTGVNDADTPGELYSRLRANPEFRLLFADRVHRHFFNGGVFYVDPARPAWDPGQPERNRPAALYHRRIGEIDPAIVLESARWGDNQRPAQPFTRDLEWVAELDRLRTAYFPQRSGVVLNQLRSLGLYPQVAAPSFNRHGGQVPAGFTLVMAATAGIIYYTLDGSDPRLALSGAVAPGARSYAATPLTLVQSTQVKARALHGTSWSALNEAVFQVAELGVPLRLTELMYHPAGGNAFEFIELQNVSPVPLDVSGFTLDGASFAFAPGSVLRPHEVLILASSDDPAAFAARYPGVAIAGWFDGSLSNSGETLALKDGQGRTLWRLAYRDADGWPREADGSGYSIEVIEPRGAPTDPANWRASLQPGGSPGIVPPAPAPPAVCLNEIMASSPEAPMRSSAESDWVELHNRGPAAVDLSAWSLSDGPDPRRFVFPTGTTLAPGAFLVIFCDRGAEAGLHAGFGLDQEGESPFLYDAATNRIDGLTYGAQPEGSSLGRDPEGVWQLGQPTPGWTNVAMETAPLTQLVLNEWLANALPGDADWIELFNLSPIQPVALRGLCVASANAQFQIGSWSFVAPRGHIRFWCDTEPRVDHVEFKLPAEGGSIRILDSAGELIDEVTYPAQTEDRSSGRLPDGTPTVVSLGALTPGRPNQTDPALSDRDADGLPDVWEDAHGLDPRRGSGEDGPGGDPDRDGFVNLAEFLAQTDPRDPASVLAIVGARVGSTGLEVSFGGVAGRRYRLESNDAWGDAWTVRAAIGPLPASEIVVLTDHTGTTSDARFYRVVLAEGAGTD